MICPMCKKETSISSHEKIDGNYVSICIECSKKHHDATIEKRLESVERAHHFKDWDGRDLSDAFWMHLGKYKNYPNRRSLDIMRSALLWACHADHGLSSSFHHALKWCGIDLYAEIERTDLPEN